MSDKPAGTQIPTNPIARQAFNLLEQKRREAEEENKKREQENRKSNSVIPEILLLLLITFLCLGFLSGHF